MDKTKAHDKHADVDSRAGKAGDMSQWQREMFKTFAGGGGFDYDIPAHPYFLGMPWSHPQHLWSHPLHPHRAHLATPASPLQTHEQEKEHEGHQGGTESIPLDKSQPSSTCDMFGPSAGAGRTSFDSPSTDTSYDELHNMGGMRPPYSSYPSGFGFPMPPYPGLDPLMLYMHQMRRQAAYLYSMPSCRNGYQSPLPVPSPGASQRGFIKIPSGLPQKQAHLWESQSSENMQLWATVTQLCATISRAEAEIFCQRGKISKLEDELEAMRTRQDALLDAVKKPTVSPQTTRKERRKRTATVPVAILGLPASQPLPVRAQVKKARGSTNEGDPIKPTGMLPSEGNSEQAHQNTTCELSNGSLKNGNENCTPLIMGLDRSPSRTDSIDKDKVDRQHSSTDLSCVGIINSSLNEGSSRGIVSEETTRETSGLENMVIKQECITDSLSDEAKRSKDEGTLDAEKDETSSIKQTCSGVSLRGSETMERRDVGSTENKRLDRTDAAVANLESGSTEKGDGDNRREGVVILSTENSSHGSLPSDRESLTRPNEISSEKMVADWHCLLQTGQVGTSAQIENSNKTMNACSLDGFDGPDEWTQEVMEVLE